MATIDLTAESFAQTIENNDIVLLDFWAEWCGPCRQFGPVFSKVSEDFPEVVFAKVDTEAQPQLAAEFGITSIPTIMAFRDKVLIFAQPGALREAQLRELIGKIKELDMESVHKEIAEAEAKENEG